MNHNNKAITSLLYFQIEMARAASLSSQDMSDLQEQNDNLRAVIKEMREQMEQLGHQIPVSDKNLQPRSGDKITEGMTMDQKI